jgi:hypothetical protein
MYFLFLNLLDVVVSFVVGNIVDAAKVEKEYIDDDSAVVVMKFIALKGEKRKHKL